MVKKHDVHENYFQGVLQLRNPSDELLVYVFESVDSAGDEVWISKEKKVKNGFDFYLSNNKFLRRIAEQLKNKFFGQTKVTATLHTRDALRSKELFRVTVLFRLAPFKRGEIFPVRGSEMKVVNIGDKVTLKDLKTGKNRLIAYEDVEQDYYRYASTLE